MNLWKKIFKREIEIDLDRYLYLIILENRAMTLKKMADEGKYIDARTVSKWLDAENKDD